MQAPDVWSAIEFAYKNPAVLEDAQRRWAEAAPNLFKPHAVELSASSAGHCILERWAYLHGKLDIPEDYASMLCKMDGGTMYGLRVATLFAAGYEATHPGSAVDLEVVSVFDGIPGHIDARIRPDRNSPVVAWCEEVKCSFWGGAFNGPMDAHFTQATIYSLGQESPGFSIATLLPAAMRVKGAPAINFVQTDEFTETHEAAARAEIVRLKRAEADEPPQADVKEPFWCRSCRFSGCAKNANVLKPKEAVA